QLVTLPDGTLHIVAPSEAEDNDACRRFLNRVVEEVNEVSGVTFVAVRQSMANGGGPACLRLRVPLTSDERAAMQQSVLLDSEKLSALEEWVKRHYRDRLSPKDLVDPQLLDECQQASESLGQLLQLPGFS